MTDLLAAVHGLFPADCRDRVFLVGGSVRDLLLGRPAADLDLAAALPAERLRRLGFALVEGKSTAPIWFRAGTPFGKVEVTPLATDGPAGAALLADLQRRDFTINALALGLDGTLYDPLGGQADLHSGRLAICSAGAFADDPLRLLRALRFEAAGWRLSAASEGLLRDQDWDAPLRAIPAERCSGELRRALAAADPARFPARLVELGLGRDWLPELFRMAAIPAGPARHHGEATVLGHSLQVLERLAVFSDDPLARFCALFHDLGKLASDPAGYPHHHGHDEAGFQLAVPFCNRLALPAAYRRALAWSSRLHTRFARWAELRPATRIRLAEQALKAGLAETLPRLRAADHPGRPPAEGWDEALAVAAQSAAQLGIDPAQLAALPAQQRAPLLLARKAERLRALLGR